jgi:hypothetical protein
MSTAWHISIPPTLLFLEKLTWIKAAKEATWHMGSRAYEP